MDANTGAIKWKLKLGIEQRNSCPLFADGKLYVPMLDDPASKGDGRGGGRDEGRVLHHQARRHRRARSSATPRSTAAVSARRWPTTASSTCRPRAISIAGARRATIPGCRTPPAEKPWPAPGPATQLQVIPSEVLLHPGEKATFRVRSLDANGFTVEESIPAEAGEVGELHSADGEGEGHDERRVRCERRAAWPRRTPSLRRARSRRRSGDLKGYIRGRVLPNLPHQAGFRVVHPHRNQRRADVVFAYPPLPWIGARFKFDVREKDGSKVLAKTIDNRFFQRATVFIGTPEMSHYTIQADVMSDGNRRKMSEVGVINQRYLIVLKGNEQKLEVNSNQERLRGVGGFQVVAERVVSAQGAGGRGTPDGSAVVRAKAWKRDEPEPAAWTIDVPHKTAHQAGSPGPVRLLTAGHAGLY